jgi:hypothetical protein
VVGFENLIDDPAGDEDAEDAVFVGQADEDGEDDEMDDALGVLAVVHGSDARDDAEECGEAGIGLSSVDRRDSGAIGGIGISVATGSGCVWGGAGSGQLGGEARFAEDCGSNRAGALLAERFAAVLAKGSSFAIRMVCAVHTSPPSCMSFKTLGKKIIKASVAAG